MYQMIGTVFEHLLKFNYDEIYCSDMNLGV
jgi:hypothetical protein